MRTDSTRISEEARAAAKVHIENTYGEEYYENRYYKTNKDDLIDDITLIYNYTDINDISSDNPSGDGPIGYPDKPNTPDLDPGFGVPDSWHKNTNSIKS